MIPITLYYQQATKQKKIAFQTLSFSNDVSISSISSNDERHQRKDRHVLSETTNDENNVGINEIKQHHPTKRLAIVGGGLAGLSTAYHFLSKINKLCSNGSSSSSSNDDSKDHYNTDTCSWNITIYDQHPIGMGGASSVAGGYVHLLVLFIYL